MRVDQLTAGCKVDIYIKQTKKNDPADTIEQKTFFTSVFDVVGEEVELHMPTSAGKLLMVPKNVRCEFVFSTSKGLYKAEGVVSEYMKRQHFYLIRVRLTEELYKFQRREFYRIPCMIPVSFLELDEEAFALDSCDEAEALAQSNEESKKGKGMILDISGGGARFISDEDLSGIQGLCMDFKIIRASKDDETHMKLMAKMIRSQKVEGQDKYMHRVQFFFQDTRTKEQLIRYVFEEDRKIRKKEQEI